MPRIARLLAVNCPHHITQRGNNRETVFFDDEDRKSYLKILKRYSDQWKFDIWAYCLMPNHVHLLVVPKEEKSLARGIGATNLVYTQYFNPHPPPTSPLTKTDPFVLVRNDPWNAQLIGWWFLI